jgi:hypothetical protein
MKEYCEYCGKQFGEEGKIYIAGTICQGHSLSIWQYIKFKIGKFLINIYEKTK